MDVRAIEPAVAAPVDEEDVGDELGDPFGGVRVILEVRLSAEAWTMRTLKCAGVSLQCGRR